MGHYDLTDAEWFAISPLFPPRTTPRGRRPFNDHRRPLDAILFVLVTEAPWRALPESYGPWETAYARLHRYRADRTFARLCRALRDALRARGAIGAEAWCLDATIVRAYKSAAGARRGGGAEKGGPSLRRQPPSPAATDSAVPAAENDEGPRCVLRRRCAPGRRRDRGAGLRSRRGGRRARGHPDRRCAGPTAAAPRRGAATTRGRCGGIYGIGEYAR